MYYSLPVFLESLVLNFDKPKKGRVWKMHGFKIVKQALKQVKGTLTNLK
jgi:hypothetical protein